MWRGLTCSLVTQHNMWAKFRSTKLVYLNSAICAVFRNCFIYFCVNYFALPLARSHARCAECAIKKKRKKLTETVFYYRWKINIKGFEGTLYEGEDFQLLFKFNNKYPFDSPEVSARPLSLSGIDYPTNVFYCISQVTFIGSNIPVHPHVYSNGHICLSILTEDWSPALSVQSVCLSIASMLSSCREKKRPPDNTLYVKTCNKNPKKTKWWYHGAYAWSPVTYIYNSHVCNKLTHTLSLSFALFVYCRWFYLVSVAIYDYCLLLALRIQKSEKTQHKQKMPQGLQLKRPPQEATATTTIKIIIIIIILNRPKQLAN